MVKRVSLLAALLLLLLEAGLEVGLMEAGLLDELFGFSSSFLLEGFAEASSFLLLWLDFSLLFLFVS